MRGAAVDDLGDRSPALTGSVVPVQTQAGCALAADQLAVGTDDVDTLGGHVAVGPGGARHPGQPADQLGRDGLVGRRAVLGDPSLVAHHHVTGGPGEDLREARGQHVGEHQ
ncbi:MAG: hypothetical protein R2731_13910 [Nocardioides sp.]